MSAHRFSDLKENNMNMYEFLTEHQDYITTGTAQAIARDLGVDLDFDLVGEAP